MGKEAVRMEKKNIDWGSLGFNYEENNRFIMATIKESILSRCKMKSVNKGDWDRKISIDEKQLNQTIDFPLKYLL